MGTGTAFIAVPPPLNGVFRRGVTAPSVAEGGAAVHTDIVEDHGDLSNATVMWRAAGFAGWLLGFLGSMAMIGIIPTIPLFVVGFMRGHARERWSLVLPMAIGLTLFVYLVFDRMLTIPWPNTVLGHWLPALQAIPSV